MRTLGRGNPGSSHLRELDSVPPANSLCHVRRHVCSSHGLGVDVFGVRYSAHRRGHSPHTQFRPPPRALQLVGKSSGPWDWMVPTRSFTHSGTAGQRPPSPGPALRDGLRGRGATRGRSSAASEFLLVGPPCLVSGVRRAGGAERDAGATRASPLRPAAPLGPASLLGVGGTFASPAVPCEAPARAGAAPCGPGDDVAIREKRAVRFGDSGPRGPRPGIYWHARPASRNGSRRIPAARSNLKFFVV